MTEYTGYEFHPGARCIIEQFKMLNRCWEKKDNTEWKEWRDASPEVVIHLQGAQLRGAKLNGALLSEGNLQGADLIYADLQGADLIAATMQGAMLQQANLQGADLRRANLQHASFQSANLRRAHLTSSELQGADLRQANLQGANLRHANLQEAKLDDATGLEPQQIGGGNLTGADLPTHIAQSDFQGPLENVAEASKQARKLFVIIVSACLYCILTTGVQTAGQALKLPVIGCEIPLEWFYVAAPVLLLALYVYLHASLQQIWEGLSLLPAVFPDGTPMHNRVHPSMLSTIVFLYFPRLSELPPRLTKLRVFLAILLGWYAVPATLLWFFLRYSQVVCNPWGVGVLGSLAVLSCILGLVFRYSARMTLVGLKDDPWWVARAVRWMKSRRKRRGVQR